MIFRSLWFIHEPNFKEIRSDCKLIINLPSYNKIEI